jgi:glutathione synthase/RimK-type ligase-like ATP-grasp enzyme
VFVYDVGDHVLMKKLAIVTWSEMPQLYPDDALIVAPLQQLGFTLETIPWDRQNMNWKAYDLVIIKSSHKYFRKYQEFIQWTKYLETAEINVLNPAATLQWNTHKKYLLDLQKKGVPIVPTQLFYKHAKIDLLSLLEKDFDGKMVIKPAIGAGGESMAQIEGTFQVTKDSFPSQQAKIQHLIQTSDFLLQPFIEEVETEGEYSFIFLGGIYSHAVIKKLSAGEFTVGRRGATVEKVYPLQDFIQQAEKIYEALPQPLLYARIDTINRQGKLHLMEAELIEPILYFAMNSGAPTTYAQAVKNFL